MESHHGRIDAAQNAEYSGQAIIEAKTVHQVRPSSRLRSKSSSSM